MNYLWELLVKIKSLSNQGYVVHRKYETGSEYGYEHIGNMTLTVILKDKIYDKGKGKYKELSRGVLDRTFNNLIKEANAETVSPPYTSELGYGDSLELLYNHYPFGETDGSNSVLIDGRGRIVAINYNGLKNTSFIHSTGIPAIPNYIVLNNKKKLNGEYKVKDYNELIPILEHLFIKK